jgi:predicted lipoprotein with Yx(FWY)xxD motif
MHVQRRFGYALATLAGVGVLAAACGGSSSGGTQSVGTGSGGGGATPSAVTAATVTTHSGPDGAYLTDGSGRTLYIFSSDKSSTSTCNGDCTKEWPPMTTTNLPAAENAVKAGRLSTSARSDGTHQVTYAGHPLYYFAEDAATGDMKGQGLDDFGGLWSAVTPAGAAVAAAQPSSEPSSSGGGSTSEWG